MLLSEGRSLCGEESCTWPSLTVPPTLNATLCLFYGLCHEFLPDICSYVSLLTLALGDHVCCRDSGGPSFRAFPRAYSVQSTSMSSLSSCRDTGRQQLSPGRASTRLAMDKRVCGRVNEQCQCSLWQEIGDTGMKFTEFRTTSMTKAEVPLPFYSSEGDIKLCHTMKASAVSEGGAILEASFHSSQYTLVSIHRSMSGEYKGSRVLSSFRFANCPGQYNRSIFEIEPNCQINLVHKLWSC